MDHAEASHRDNVEPAPPGEVDRRRAAQAEQMDELGGTPTTPAMPKPMFAGMVKGALIGAVVGALLLTPLAFVGIFDTDLVARLAICWIAGAAAGATMGAVFLGGARGEMSNPENEEYVYAQGRHERHDGPGIR